VQSPEDINDIIARAVHEAPAAAGIRPAQLPPPIDPDALLTREDGAAALTARGLRTSRKTLATLVTRGGGPPYRRFGTRVLYRWSDLLTWAEARLSAPRRSTAEGDHNTAPAGLQK
jgi:hypothetical protein